MVKLTTSSPASDFRFDLGNQFSAMLAHAKNLGKIHRQIEDKSNMHRWGQRSGFPDEIAFHTGFSMVLASLQRIVENMQEAEDALLSLQDDGEDETEILHAMGELFAAKTIYLSLVAGIQPLEESRVNGTSVGLTAHEYFTALYKEGRPPAYNPAQMPPMGMLSASSIVQGSISPKPFAIQPVTFSGIPKLPQV